MRPPPRFSVIKTVGTSCNQAGLSCETHAEFPFPSCAALQREGKLSGADHRWFGNADRSRRFDAPTLHGIRGKPTTLANLRHAPLDRHPVPVGVLPVDRTDHNRREVGRALPHLGEYRPATQAGRHHILNQ